MSWLDCLKINILLLFKNKFRNKLLHETFHLKDAPAMPAFRKKTPQVKEIDLPPVQTFMSLAVVKLRDRKLTNRTKIG
ncbi:uncharacterized protein N7458_000948 [Penicillium daleae]|uniref:Uncharacterized protein n=1 Tax=Penicillium daleae TaxID=63821 RepID=A0AAD6CIT1_9EURO|nr:uncharacterized protein N7458_000948 [Penicillium daleae]KAJ5465262.1 hypothetical protein N7458_000948 [Penicillium daleae]